MFGRLWFSPNGVTEEDPGSKQQPLHSLVPHIFFGKTVGIELDAFLNQVELFFKQDH